MYILVYGRNVPTPAYPEQGVFELDQAKALAEYGHKVVLAAVDLRSIRRWRKWGFESITANGIEALRFSVPMGALPRWLMKMVGRPCFALLCRRIEKTHGRPDVIHAHFGEMAMYAADYCRKEKLPLVVTEHSSSVNVPNLPPAYAHQLAEVYSVTDALVAVSAALAENIQRNLGFSAAVVHNIVDAELFASVPLKAARGEPFVFLSASDMNAGKGFDILLDAFAKLLKKQPNVRLRLMGGGAEEAALRQQARMLGLESQTDFSGRFTREEFAGALSQADAFVMASRGETFGVVYVEALAAGVPIIATACGGPADIVQEDNGLLVPPENAEALAEAMEKMYQTAWNYDRATIRADAVKRYAPETIAEQLTEIYKRICER